MNRFRISSETMWHEINDQFKETGGVYILKCSTDTNNFVPAHINRLLTSDDNGILYIGKANSFIDRVAELKKSISPQYNSSSHECGSRYKDNPGISKKLPYNQLFIELVGSDNPRDTEEQLLQRYQDEFGELPPLNRVS